MPLQLQYTQPSSVPLEVEGITPDAVCGKSLAEIEQMTIFQGNASLPLAEFFQVSGDSQDQTMDWQGDLAGVHWIGAGMTGGVIRISGTAGRHLGSEMRGGRIEVQGDAGDWVGAEMRGGLIHVRGRAGHLVGAAYRGSARGMRGGTILIGRDAGNEIGHTMRRGLVVVGGNIGDLAAFNILAGTVLVMGESGIRHAAGMRRGTLGFLGTHAPAMLPSFRYACRYQPIALRLVLAQLRQHAFPFPDELWQAQFDLYQGDMIEGGRGEILVRAA